MQLWRETCFKNTEILPTSILNACICIEPFVSSWVFVDADSMQDRSLFTCQYWWKLNWHAVSPLAFFNERMLLRRNTSSLHLSQMLLLLLLARRSPGWNWASIWPHPWSGSRLKKRHLEVWSHSFSFSDLKDLQNIEGVKIKVLRHQMSGGSFWAKYWVLSAF